MNSKFITLTATAVVTFMVAAAEKKPTPKAGLATPGILIPLSALVPEAEIATDSPAVGMQFNDATLIATATAVQRIDAKTNKPVEPPVRVKIENGCGGMISAFNALWVPACGNRTLTKIDTGGGGRRSEAAKPAATAPRMTLAASIATSKATAPSAVAANDDSVWLLSDARTTLQRIDPRENAIAGELRLPPHCAAILFADSSIWAACPTENRVIRIDPKTSLVSQRIEVAAEPIALAFGEDSLWVLGRKEGKLSRVDPKTNKVTATVDLGIPGATTGALAFGEGSLWASLPGFPVIRVSPAAGKEKVLQEFHGEGGGGLITFGLGSVWVASPGTNSVKRYDPKRIVATLAE